MRRPTNFFRHKPKTLLATLLVLAGAFVWGSSAVVKAADCDTNAIIHCGFSTASGFISDVKNNSDDAGHHDLQAIYQAYGLVPADYSRFVTSARPGTAFKDGRIVVDGQVVATGAKSIGRDISKQGSNPFSITIHGVKYYGNTNAKAFASDSIPVMVLFNAQGVMQFAVLTSCGNPTNGTNVVPSYSCNLLQKTAVSGTPNTYSFTTSASAANNAKVVKVVYNFGDGSAPVTSTSLTTPVQHTFTKSATTTVTVYVSLPGNQTVTVTSAKCATVITVQTPFFNCIQLTGAIIDQSKFSFSFTATASFGNGATFSGADFDFGDGKSATGLKPSGTSVTTQHTYATAGTYHITATLHFMVNGVVQSTNCTASVSPNQQPTPECKPGVPQGSPLCNACASNPSVPASDTEHCTTTLVNTGAGDVIAIFGAVVVAGFLIFRQFIYRRNAMQADGSTVMGGMTDHPNTNETLEASVDEPTLEQQVHRNSQGLNHTAYHRPHRFRPRSHNDHQE